MARQVRPEAPWLTATRHSGSKDGAVTAGERAAEEVVEALGIVMAPSVRPIGAVR